MALLEVKNLKTYYETKAGEVKAVDDVSFKLEKGETLGLAGESGCGKTTTCLSIMRMIQPPGRIVSGEIIYNSTNVLKLPTPRNERFKTFAKKILFPQREQIKDQSVKGSINLLHLPVIASSSSARSGCSA